MYTHFGHGCFHSGGLDARFTDLMRRLSRKNGWFVPVGTLLDYLRRQRGDHTIAPSERASLERRWIWHKARFGTA